MSALAGAIASNEMELILEGTRLSVHNVGFPVVRSEEPRGHGRWQ
jgi:hypothetical protein